MSFVLAPGGQPTGVVTPVINYLRRESLLISLNGIRSSLVSGSNVCKYEQQREWQKQDKAYTRGFGLSRHR